MNPTSIALIKAMVRCLSLTTCQQLAEEVRTLGTSDDVAETVKGHLKRMVQHTEVESILDSLFDDPSMIGDPLEDEQYE